MQPDSIQNASTSASDIISPDMSAHQIILLLLLSGMVAISYGRDTPDKKSIEFLQQIFGDSISVSTQKFRLTTDEKREILRTTKSRWSGDSVHAFICTIAGRAVGYGFIDHVKGKTQFITYLVAITPSGEVRDLDILAYREAYGGEIGYETFRKQFRGKTSGDELTPGISIKNISGATISVRAITLGVKKILTTFAILKPRL